MKKTISKLKKVVDAIIPSKTKKSKPIVKQEAKTYPIKKEKPHPVKSKPVAKKEEIILKKETPLIKSAVDVLEGKNILKKDINFFSDAEVPIDTAHTLDIKEERGKILINGYEFKISREDKHGSIYGGLDGDNPKWYSKEELEKMKESHI